MNYSVKRGLVGLATAAFIVSAPMLPAASAQGSNAILCRASVQDATPQQYTYNSVYVRTAPSAVIRTVAHYKTTETRKAARANTAGRGSIRYYISGSTPGFRVWIDVFVTKGGQTGSCRTSFVPHR